MKLLHVIPSVGPNRGGPTYAVLQTVKYLRELGVDSEIVTTNDNGPGKILEVPLNRLTEYEGVPVRFFQRFSSSLTSVNFNADKAFLFSSDMTKWLWKSIHNYDALETRYLFCYAPDCARIIAQIKKVPYVVHPTGQLTSWALSQSARKKKIYSWLLERRNLKYASVIQCSSPGEVEDVRKFGVETPTFVAPNGVDIPVKIPDANNNLLRKYKISSKATIILFLSRLHPKKRPDFLIRALQPLATQGKNFHLILAGSGDEVYIDELKSLVDSLNLTDKVTFAGFVIGKDKELLLQGSDIFALPSFSENFGIAVAEAMASSLPVVITPGIQICHDVIESDAGLVVEGKVELFSTAILQLIESPELRRKLGKQGKSLVLQKYAWNIVSQKILSVYKSIAK